MHAIQTRKMGSEKRYMKSRSRKRKFQGNKRRNSIDLTDNASDEQSATTSTGSADQQGNSTSSVVETNNDGMPLLDCASAKKLKLDISSAEQNIDGSKAPAEECYVLFNTFILKDFIEDTMKCPICSSDVQFNHDIGEKRGLCHFFHLSCISCDFEKTVSSSRKVKKSEKRKSFDINLRTPIAFREIGRGYTSIRKFCGIMNMSTPMTKFAYELNVKRLNKKYKDVAQMSMNRGANEAIPEKLHVTSDGIKPVTASFDGTWQRRGYASLNGVVTSICQGKCVDVAIMTKSCRSCKFWNPKKGTPEYNQWKEKGHDCSINHSGSAGSMEAAGAMSIYERSIEHKGLRYLKYRGDGDSKSFALISEADPYKGFSIEKSECVGHVQKRVGSRLRTLKDNMKGKVLDDGKKLTGQGRLTNHIMNTLQNYYGLAIRQNKGNVYAMKKSIAAIIHHCSENKDNELRHKFCPRTADSWCLYQSDKITKKNTYKPHINIPEAVATVIRPIFSFKDLAADDLLTRCIDGETQNANEALNQIIWKRLPKDVFVGRSTLEIGVYSAIIGYNDGYEGLLKLIQCCGLEPGAYTKRFFSREDISRVKASTKRSSEKVKLRRKVLHSKRKGYQDKNLETEGETYLKGGF